MGDKAAPVAGWICFINSAMTGMLVLPPSLCICITGVRLAACRSGSLRSLHFHRWHHESDGVKWFAEMEFWFTLIKLLAV
ncbi:hypothetical protein ACNKHR_27890 [Shigella flexneri]